jgi:glutathione S-transferase
VWAPGTFSQDKSTHEGICAKSRKNVRDCFRFVEEGLGERDEGSFWAVRDGFTVVDVFLFVIWRWGNAYGFDMGENYPAYDALARRVAERKSVREAVREEGIPVLGV